MMTVEQYLEIPKKSRQAHLLLEQPCVMRGGNSTQHRGILAQFLGTRIFGRPADLCHACNNDKCSNPHHLYWGTRSENVEDAKNNGTWKSAWERSVEKYGLEEAKRRNKLAANPSKAGAGNKGKPKSDAHKKNISKSLTNRSR